MFVDGKFKQAHFEITSSTLDMLLIPTQENSANHKNTTTTKQHKQTRQITSLLFLRLHMRQFAVSKDTPHVVYNAQITPNLFVI